VRKEAQGKGVGSALLGDLFRRLRWQGMDYISVNTQADNYASLQLYQKFGFTRTGEQYPVYTYEVGASS
jgi:ribosomal protein S18 acetylase RimI-like enzyme